MKHQAELVQKLADSDLDARDARELRQRLEDPAADDIHDELRLHAALVLGHGKDAETFQNDTVDRINVAAINKDTFDQAIRRATGRKAHRRIRAPKTPPDIIRKRSFPWPALFAVAACVAIAVVAGLLFRNTEEKVVLELVEGSWQVDRKGKRITAANGFEVRSKDVLHNFGEPGLLRYADGTTIRAYTECRLQRLPAGYAKHWRLTDGRIECQVTEQPPKYPMVLFTPQMAATVQGTRFTVSTEPSRTHFDLTEGKVIIATARNKMTIVGPDTVTAHADGRIERVETPPPIVLYRFDAGTGDVIHDHAGGEPASDLAIADLEAVEWLPDGGLKLKTPTKIAGRSAATRIINACRKTNELSIEAWIQPAGADRETKSVGMDRIVTLSSGNAERNFSLGQGDFGQHRRSFVVRLRTATREPRETIPGRDAANGFPVLATPKLDFITERIHLCYARDALGKATIWVNGAKVSSDTTYRGTFANWDDSFGLGLGQELRESEDAAGKAIGAWSGSLYRIAIYNRALTEKDVQQLFTALTPEE